MATYCFKCTNCGTRFELPTRNPTPSDYLPGKCCKYSVLKRDYKTELDSQSVFVPIHMQSRVDVSRDDVLPTAKDFETPDDPDGSKGFKEFKASVKPVHKGAWV